MVYSVKYKNDFALWMSTCENCDAKVKSAVSSILALKVLSEEVTSGEIKRI